MTSSQPVDLTAFKEQKRAEFHSRLVALCSPRSFPKQDIDQVTGAAINPQGAADLLEMFQLFGITELDPNSEGFDTVLEYLVPTDGKHFFAPENRAFPEFLNKARRSTWHPDYLRYVDAHSAAGTAGRCSVREGGKI